MPGDAVRFRDPMTEDQLQAAVLDLCKLRGLLAYHTHDSRRSQPGFPDLVIAGSRGHLFRELKGSRGRTSTAQANWLYRLGASGDAAIWTPADLRSGRIQKELEGIR